MDLTAIMWMETLYEHLSPLVAHGMITEWLEGKKDSNLIEYNYLNMLNEDLLLETLEEEDEIDGSTNDFIVK